MRTVMKACIILCNLTTNERLETDMAQTEQVDDSSISDMSTSDLARHYAKLQDREKHEALLADLIAFRWQTRANRV